MYKTKINKNIIKVFVTHYFNFYHLKLKNHGNLLCEMKGTLHVRRATEVDGKVLYCYFKCGRNGFFLIKLHIKFS